MSDGKADSSNESTEEMITALTRNMPAFMQAQNKELLPTAQAQLETSKEISPAYQQLMTDLYKQFAPQLAQTGSEVDRISRTAAAETDADILDTFGRRLADVYKSIDTNLNPEYYQTRALGADSLKQLLGSINLDDASPEAERLVNQENIRSGNLGNNSATNTVSNALSFGSEMSNRRSQLSNAINTASAFLQPASNAQFNPATAALNRPTSNSGTSQFGGVTKPGEQAYNAGNNMLNNLSQIKQTEMGINANRRDILDRMNETASSIPT
jgi:hypothetical protein